MGLTLHKSTLMTDPFSQLDWIDDELSQLRANHLLRTLQVRNGPQSVYVRLGDEFLINFSSNDYLSLAADQRLAQAAQRAALAEGCGAGASPLLNGRGEALANLESALARFTGTEAALVFTSGYAANIGTIGALVGAEDVVFSDELNHASLIDGCRLSRAKICIFRHGDLEHLQQLLREEKNARRRLIVTDTLFSMEGSFADLPSIVDIAEHHHAMLLVDESHATGVWGESGQGLAEHMGVAQRIPIRMGTLSKALGSGGGFVCGERRLVDWLSNRARSFVFSTGISPLICGAANEAIEIVLGEPQRRHDLQLRAELTRKVLQQRGWNCGSSQSQIIPIIVGESELALELSRFLRSRRILIPAVRPPTVPPGKACLRISLNYLHNDELLMELFAALDQAAGEPRFRPALRK